MKTPLIWVGALLTLWLNGCTVMPRQIMDEALPPLPFSELTRNVDRYIGETVVLGGYVLSVENLKDHTQMMVLQTPLGAGQRPKSKDVSQGRITLLFDGFLDAEVFTKDRRVTVGGRIIEPMEGRQPPYPHIRIAVRDIHLWPFAAETYDPYYYDNWHYYPWGWHYPWHHRHYHHW